MMKYQMTKDEIKNKKPKKQKTKEAKKIKKMNSTKKS